MLSLYVSRTFTFTLPALSSMISTRTSGPRKVPRLCSKAVLLNEATSPSSWNCAVSTDRNEPPGVAGGSDGGCGGAVGDGGDTGGGRGCGEGEGGDGRGGGGGD